MAEYIYVTPREGALVKHPDTFIKLPAEGKRVKADSYWLRMRDQGLVTIGADALDQDGDKPVKPKVKK